MNTYTERLIFLFAHELDGETMKKDENDKCQSYVSTTESESETKKTAWDMAKEWQNLGKDKIRKMQHAEVCVSH